MNWCDMFVISHVGHQREQLSWHLLTSTFFFQKVCSTLTVLSSSSVMRNAFARLLSPNEEQQCLHGFQARFPVNVKASLYASFSTFLKTSYDTSTTFFTLNITDVAIKHNSTVWSSASNILGIFTGFSCKIMESTFLYLGNHVDASHFIRNGHTVSLLFSIRSFLFL